MSPTTSPTTATDPKKPTSSSSPKTEATSYPTSLPTSFTTSKSEKLVPIGTLRGGATGYWFGSSVSLSYNGNALAVGSPYYKNGELSNVGIAQVFHRQEQSQWVEALNSTGRNKNDLFGLSMSLSGDGMQLAVGTYRQDNGYAKLVEMETGNEITIVGDESDCGRSVSVSHDGNRVAVYANDYVQVFQVQEDGSLDKIGENFLTDDAWPIVALSANGDTLAIGERSYDKCKGRVMIFKWNSGEWKQLGRDMVGGDKYDHFGRSLDLTAEGHRVIIGTYRGKYAKVYDYDGSDWEVVGGKLTGELNDNGLFGSSVSISDNGSRIVIGSPDFKSDGLEYRGRAVVYQYENGAWNQIGHDILGKNAGDNAGASVAISGDGNIVSIGAHRADSIRGYVIIYEVN